MKEQYTYEGKELAFFEKAVNWKSYFSSLIKPFIGNIVLEVGTGIGATTALLNDGAANQWTLLEPDNAMVEVLKKKIRDNPMFSNCIVEEQIITGLSKEKKFDTIIYIDVLEHIGDDAGELLHAADLLQQNGHLIIISPAYQFLFSPFDAAIGHYRRYSANSLKAILPPSLKPVKFLYLDSTGFFASLANKILLKQKYPTQEQIKMWDKWMIPVSKLTDKIFFHSFGKSVLLICKKQ